MSPQEKITSLLEEARLEHTYSGYQLYCECGDDRFECAGGVTSYWPNAKPINSETLFDIGSITKAVVTTSLFALGFQKKQWTLQDPLGKWISDLKSSPLGSLQLGELLSHSSGLIDWYPLYRELGKEPLLEWIKKSASALLVEKPRVKAVYSDLGFILLGICLEKKQGDLEKAYLEQVAAPLSMKKTQFGPLKKREDAVATEFSLEKKQLIQGEVFDENCAKLGGKSGHAGLFSTAKDLALWCREWLRAVKGSSLWLDKETALLFTRPALLVASSTWSYGWDTKSKLYSTSGDFFSMASFGHLGFTGCSVWLDPEVGGFAVFLTNRVHPSRFDERIKRLRPKVHDEIAKMWRN